MSFNINKHQGEVKKATLPNGTVVNRVEAIFVEEYRTLIKCAEYQDHFIFENPDKRPGTPAYLCTCGHVAVIAPPSPAGMFFCLFDVNSGLRGYHATSLYNKDEFEKVKGSVLDMDKIRKELI